MSGIYYGCLSVISHVPGPTLAKWSPGFWDKAAHFSVYLVLGAILAVGFFRLLGSNRRLRALIVTSAVVLLLGAIDEIHQLFVVGRFESLGDALADFLGGTTGGLLALLVPGLLRTPPPLKT